MMTSWHMRTWCEDVSFCDFLKRWHLPGCLEITNCKNFKTLDCPPLLRVLTQPLTLHLWLEVGFLHSNNYIVISFGLQIATYSVHDCTRACEHFFQILEVFEQGYGPMAARWKSPALSLELFNSFIFILWSTLSTFYVFLFAVIF